MTNTTSGRRTAPDAQYDTDTYVEPSGWAGWVGFAGFMLILGSVFQIIVGLVALFDDGYYAVRSNGLVVHVSYTTWGWVHVILGVIAGLTGVGLLIGNMFARVVGVVIAMAMAIVNLAFAAAYPVWSLTLIAVDVIVIYAIVAHGRELKNSV